MSEAKEEGDGMGRFRWVAQRDWGLGKNKTVYKGISTERRRRRIAALDHMEKKPNWRPNGGRLDGVSWAHGKINNEVCKMGTLGMHLQCHLTGTVSH